MKKIHWVTLAALGALAGPAIAGDTFNFDDIDPGVIGDQYLARGVRFFKGNGSEGISGAPTATSAEVLDDTGFASSGGNILVSTPHSEVDIWVQFFNAQAQHTTVTRIGVTNDQDPDGPSIYIEGFNSSGLSLGRTAIGANGGAGVFTAGQIYSAKIYAAPNSNAELGVDDFTFLTGINGDTNFSGTVDATDFSNLAANFGGTNKTWDQGDFNGDKIVNSLDFNALASNFGNSFSGSQPALGATVPEPTIILAPCLMAAGACARRRQRARRI